MFFSFGKHNAENAPHSGTCSMRGDELIGVDTQTFPNNVWIQVSHCDNDKELDNGAPRSILPSLVVLTRN